MPQAIPLLFTAAGAAGLIGAGVATWLSIASSVAIGLYQRDKGRKAERRARRAYEASLQDRTITLRSAISTRTYVLGTVRVGGTMMYADTMGAQKQFLDSVVALAGNQCAVEGYYLNDDFIAVADFPGAKFGRDDVQERHETHQFIGPLALVNLDSNPIAGSIQVHWHNSSGSGTATAVAGTGTLVNLSGLPSVASTVDISYQTGLTEKMQLQFKDGAPDQVSTPWLEVSAPRWTAAHRLRGVCHIRTLMTFDENLFPIGAPNVGAILKGLGVDGHPFFDPRDSSNPLFTDNPALLALWFMTLARNRGGMGIPIDWINLAWIITAANTCDELVTVKQLDGSGTEQIKRYTCNTVIDTDTPPAENLDIILSAMNGRRVFTASLYRVVAGAFRASTLTLTDAHVIGTEPISVVTSSGDDAPANLVTARFADATSNWAETSPKPVRNDTYITLDGHESPIDIPLPATTDPRRANYLMGVALEQNRPAFGITLTVGGVGEDLAIFDTVQLNLANRPTYAGKTYEIVKIVDKWDGEFELTLIEIRTQTWALDPNTWTPTNPIVPPDLSYLWNVPPLTNFQAVIGTPQVLPDGTSVARAVLVWDLPTQAYVHQAGRIELRYREQAGQWIGIASVPGDSTGTTVSASLSNVRFYQFQARVVNGIGAASAWVSAWLQVEGTELAAGVQGPGLFTWTNLVGVTTTPSSIKKSGSVAAVLSNPGFETGTSAGYLSFEGTVVADTASETGQSFFPNWPIMNVCCVQGAGPGALDASMAADKDAIIVTSFYPTTQAMQNSCDAIDDIWAQQDTTKIKTKILQYLTPAVTYKVLPNPITNERAFNLQLILDPVNGSPLASSSPRWKVHRTGQPGDAGLCETLFQPLTDHQVNITAGAGLNTLGEDYATAYWKKYDNTWTAAYKNRLSGVFHDVFNQVPATLKQNNGATTVTDPDYNNDGIADVATNFATSGTGNGGRQWALAGLNTKAKFMARFPGKYMAVNGARWPSDGAPLPLNTAPFFRTMEFSLQESVQAFLSLTPTGSGWTVAGTPGATGRLQAFYEAYYFHETNLRLEADIGTLVRGACFMHSSCNDRVPTSDDIEAMRFMSLASLLVERAAPCMSAGTGRLFSLDDLLVELGAPLAARSMGTFDLLTGNLTLRAPDFISGVAKFFWARFAKAIVIIRGDTPATGVYPSADAAVTIPLASLPALGAGLKYQRLPPIYTNPNTGRTTRNQSPALNNGADVTSIGIALKPIHAQVLRIVAGP